MMPWLKHILPAAWKHKFKQMVLQWMGNLPNEVSELKQRLDNLQQHTENITSLITTTTQNLDTVGKSLESIHVTQSAAMESLQHQLQDTHRNLSQTEISQFILYHHLPEELILYPENKAVIDQFLKEMKFDKQLQMNLSKNDIMFLYSLAEYKNMNVALHHYVTVGFNGFYIIKKIIEQGFFGPSFQGSILDFASGYGRVTRFLAAYYNATNITTSDIKPEAVDFQTKHFGVHGLYSTEDPAHFSTDKRFDIIFVGSLFSHLDRLGFEQWFFTLLHLLTPQGYLIFSVHDMSLHPEKPQRDHVFVAQNEDEKFPFIETRIKSAALYGISFVTEEFIQQLLMKHRVKLYAVRYKKLFGGLQDVYVVSANTVLPPANLNWEA